MITLEQEQIENGLEVVNNAIEHLMNGAMDVADIIAVSRLQRINDALVCTFDMFSLLETI